MASANPLKKMILAGNQPSSRPLVARIEQQLMANAVLGMRPEDGVWHPSVISSCICPRQAVIRSELQDRVPKPVPPDPHLQMIFDEGTLRHRYLQRDVFGPMQILWGRWRDPINYNNVVTGFQPPPREFAGYETPDGRVILTDSHKTLLNWEYIECRMYDQRTNIGGATDGILALKTARGYSLKLLELKSCNSNVFKSLLKPLEKHERQVECYINLEVQFPEVVEQLGTNRVDGAIFVYVCKDNSDYKTFDYVRQPHVFDEVVGPVRQANAAIANKTLPPKLTECLRTNSTRAKECWCRRECFTVGTGPEGFSELRDVPKDLEAPVVQVVEDDSW